jgi:hypothetical protein
MYISTPLLLLVALFSSVRTGEAAINLFDGKI